MKAEKTYRYEREEYINKENKECPFCNAKIKVSTGRCGRCYAKVQRTYGKGVYKVSKFVDITKKEADKLGVEIYY